VSHRRREQVPKWLASSKFMVLVVTVSKCGSFYIDFVKQFNIYYFHHLFTQCQINQMAENRTGEATGKDPDPQFT
jgi:hypothetical protein